MFSLGRLTPQNPVAARQPIPHGDLEKRRLTAPRLAGEHQRRGQELRAGEYLLEGVKLVLPTDDFHSSIPPQTYAARVVFASHEVKTPTKYCPLTCARGAESLLALACCSPVVRRRASKLPLRVS
jgi:hypothetical protein